jgi:2-(1,2-epoxy-1,2-dihydrophenyl)acetyl-CoA isomerase
MNSVIFIKENGVGYITFNRPEKYNSFNRDLALGVQQCLKDCGADDAIRCIYFTGSGKAFCAGQDLAEATDPQGPGLETIVRDHYNPIIRLIRNIEKPVIAAVNGVAAGAGANIALACDIVLASENASFIQAFSKIGLIPDSAGTFFLPRLVGMQLASALTMTGDKVTAADAMRMGMVYKCFSVESFESESKNFAVNLANMPTIGIGLTKRLLNSSYNNDLEKQLEMEKELQVAASKTEDHKEGITAFLEKRNPTFKGK